MTETIVVNPNEEVSEVLDLDEVELGKLLQKSEDIEALCTDHIVKNVCSKNMRFNDNAGITFIDTDHPELGIQSLDLSRHALSQLCAKMGVPVRYLEKCIQSGRIDLAKDNVNSWLEDYGKDLFIREYNGRVRGVLSNKYAVCDTPEILEVIDDVLDLNTFKVKGSFINEERLHLRLISKEMLPIEDEDLFAGIFIDSSDVGRSILTVRFGIYKQVCTNGLIVSRAGGVLFQQKHIGISADEFHEGLSNSISRIGELTENSVNWITNVMSMQSGFTKDMFSSDEAIGDTAERITKTLGVAKESALKIVSLMYTKYDFTMWGYINSITEVAQRYTLEKRIELEKIAGNLLLTHNPKKISVR